MRRIVDLNEFNWLEQADFGYLPEQGLSVLVRPVWQPDPGHACSMPESTVYVMVVDVSVEDIAVIIAMASLMTLPEDVPAEDLGEQVYHQVLEFAGRRMGWSRWVSVSGAWAISTYFEDEELQREVLGTEALRWFESDEVREAREREAAVVSAVWREMDEAEA